MKSPLLFLFVFLQTLAFSQANILFEEDFEDANLNVTYSFSPPVANLTVKDTSDFYTGTGRALYLNPTTGSQSHYINLPTINYSDVATYNGVELQFDLIARLYLVNGIRLEYSTNNKVSWNPMNSNNYRGESALFPPNTPVKFNELSYDPWRVTIAQNGVASPTDSTFWRKIRFEIKSLFNLAQSNQLSIRLKLEQLVTPPGGFNVQSGLFLDNIKFVASNCNYVGRTIKVDSVNACPLPKNTLTLNTFPFSIPLLCTTDNHSTVDSLYVTTVYNGVVSYHKLTKNIANKFEGSLIIDQPGDSIQYKISVLDSCGVLSTLPTQGFYTFNARQVPSKCGTGGCSGIYSITNLPYLQNFEAPEWQATSTRGTWPATDKGGLEVLPTPQFMENAWCVAGANQNPNSLAGPGIINYPNIGQKYLLFRPDIGGLSITSSFKTPCIQVANDSDLVFSFNYYMFGPNMGSLHIDVDTSSTFEQYVLNRLIIDGQQQSGQGQPFKTARISLEEFAGKTIRLRVRAKKHPLGAFGYIAVDNLQVNRAKHVDVTLSKLSLKDALCGSANGDSIYIDLINFGSFTGKVPLVLQLNNSPTLLHDTVLVNSSMTPNAIRFGLKNLLSNVQAVNLLKVWHQLPGDSFSEDDTISLNFRGAQSIIQVPYFQNFDSLNTLADLESWELSVHNSSNLPNPVIVPKLFDNIYPSYTSGPTNLIGGKGKYLGFSPQNANSSNLSGELLFTLSSSCIDLTNVQHAQLSFLLHYSGGYLPNVKCYISTDGTQFNYHSSLSINASAPSKTLPNYKPLSLDLSAYAGQKVRLKLELNTTSVSSYKELGLAIDNISISTDAGADLALLELTDNFFGANTADVKAQVANMRPTNYTDSLTLHLSFIPDCGGPSLQRVYKSASSLTGNTASEITFINNNPVPAGAYSIKAYISAKADSTPNNDSLQSILGYLVNEPLPYFNDFENCLNGFKNEGEFQLWKRNHYPANYIPRPGNYALSSDSTLGFSPREEIIVTPRFVGLDTLKGINLSFYSRLFGSGTDGIVEMNYGAGWMEVLGNEHVNGLNWPTNLGDKFTNQNSKFHFIELRLPHGISSIRFRFKSIPGVNNSGGWIIDDLRVSYGIQYDVSPTAALVPHVATLNKRYPVGFKVTNFGKQPLSSFNLELIQNQTTSLYNGNFTTPNPIPEGQSRVFQIPVPVQFSSSTSVVEFQLITALPNNRIDGVLVNDTTLAKVRLHTSTTLPYCNDFEDGLLPPTGNSANTGSRSFLWENGSPVKGSFNGPFSGSKALATKLTTSYDIMEDEVFYLPIFTVSDTACYALSFDHQFNTEQNFDGGTVEYSIDSGSTWLNLGEEDGDTNWFNTKYIQSLDFVKPGFSGNSGGYIKAVKNFSLPYTGSLMLRFRFGSNVEIQHEGWAIDNICFEKTNSNCTVIGLPEYAVDKSALVDLYPNPATSEVRITSDALALQVTSIRVHSAAGKTLTLDSQYENEQTLVLPIQHLAPGFYWVELLLSDGSFVQKKFVKQ